MQRDECIGYWDEAWTEGLWHAQWSRTLENLTAEQAATHPAPGRHSIWQIVNHIVFWRTYVIDRTRNGDKLNDEQVEERNWVEPADVNDQAWADAQHSYERSHTDFRAFMADEAIDIEAFKYMPWHDSYHIGQIMYVRAWLGLPPIE